ncbi:MAG: HAD-IA family hydrolase [Oscillospiraceae bacterium]|nr:HAD-IA family hydrolase [Oscillospiraceae bacterium]
MRIGILFDLDGTLLNTLDDLTDAVNYAMAQFGCPARTPRDVRSFLGNGAKQLIALSLPEYMQPQVDAVLDVYRNYYNAHCQIKTGPYAGIPEALKKLGEKYPLAVVSNKPDSATKPLIAQYFPGIYALGERADCPRKPAPDMLKRAMADIGVEACVYVGDSEVDVLTARNTGVPCVAVSWGFRDRDVLEESHPAFICDDPANLVEMIEKAAESIEA